MAEEKGQVVGQNQPEELDKKVGRLANAVGQSHDADVIIFTGGIADPAADNLIRLCKSKTRRPNVFLILTTRGGSPDAAFRMARCLQTHYSRTILYIHGRCKSAGTLVAVGADELILSDFGEFGPLDVQLDKPDELFESTSGLDINQALTSLNTRMREYFSDAMAEIRDASFGQISTKFAAEYAAKLAVGAYSAIYNQVEPMQLGAIERAVNIANQYGTRLANRINRASNLHDKAVARLVTSYPSHSFVIDLEEAKTLFRNVRAPTDVEEELGECLSFVTRDETRNTFVELLNAQEVSHDRSAQPGDSAAGERKGSGQDHVAPNQRGEEDGRQLPIPPLPPLPPAPPNQ